MIGPFHHSYIYTQNDRRCQAILSFYQILPAAITHQTLIFLAGYEVGSKDSLPYSFPACNLSAFFILCRSGMGACLYSWYTFLLKTKIYT